MQVNFKTNDKNQILFAFKDQIDCEYFKGSKGEIKANDGSFNNSSANC